MISSIVSLILALAKIIPAIEELVSQLTTAYVARTLQKNAKIETDKNARDDADVDAAAGGLPELCATCPFARHRAAHGDGSVEVESPVSSSGKGGP